MAKIGRLLLIIVVCEVGLMGSGRMLQLGPLTLRMWLYGLGLIYAVVATFFARRLSVGTILALVSMAAILLLGVGVGSASSAQAGDIAEDVKPLLFFLSLLFFESVIISEHDVELVVHLLRRVGLFLCFCYLVVFALLVSGVISFATLYAAAVVMSDEFFFRGQSGMFMYKGALYIGIALIYFLFAPGVKQKVFALLCLLVLVGTGTRGFLVALLGTLGVYILTAGIWNLRRVFLAAAGTAVAGVGLALSVNLAKHGDSDVIRVITMQQVIDRIGTLSFVFGHGFGIGVPMRPTHMEVTFLEVFHKQGIMGLLWWLFVILILCYRFQMARRQGTRHIVYPLFLGVVFVIIESWTNPYVTNPIGMAILVIGMSCLRVLGRPRRVSPSEPTSTSLLSASRPIEA